LVRPERPGGAWPASAQSALHLGFPIVALSEFEAVIAAEVAIFRSCAGQKAFSAVTLFRGQARVIVHNDAHDRKRQAANIAHELAHGLLLHPPKPPFNANGSRHYEVVEAEANWLGPALLISDEAAIHIVERKLSFQAASDHYGASVEVVRMRLNVSAAATRVARRTSGHQAHSEGV
jgi:Zn-dependent peptidase ImmA (M78 family)